LKSIFLQIISVVLVLFTVNCYAEKDFNRTIIIDGVEREYILELPSKYDSSTKYPLLLVFHGGGGRAKQMRNYSGFKKLIDKEIFIAVYPEGQNKQWKDGRIGKELPTKNDDVKFISQLIDTLKLQYNIDTNRVFSTGISNGGFFSFYLAYKLSDKIKAIAPVCANIPENIKDDYKLNNSVSMLLINGTDDPLVKYEGGKVGFGRSDRGNSISTDETIKIWMNQLGCEAAPAEEKIPDKDKEDECEAVKYTYKNCKGNFEQQLIKIIGGGHTWPGSVPYLPKFIVGKVCNDFNAEEVIWNFFKQLVMN
jgi:polyhydroxybutyrate depolymerase